VRHSRRRSRQRRRRPLDSQKKQASRLAQRKGTQTMIRLLASSALLTLALVLASGCVKPTIEGRQDPFPPSQIMFASKDLKDKTAVGAPVVSRDETGGILHVTVPVRAATDLQLYVDYRTTFFDRNGQQISQTGWSRKTLAPNVPDRIVVNSMGPNAADFQIDLRYAQ
jgi:hypothetical protein